jgi:hypothetical protein
VHEWDTDLDEAFLIMEHVDGVSLAELLDAYAPLDADEAAAVLAPVCSALAFAPDNGVLHLDLKPENVLVTRDGLVKVGDFGVASLTNAAGQAISAGGTLGYMPPEQLHGRPVDARSDIWALGALAFEVLTGAVPMASDTVEGALYKAEYVTPAAPGEFVDTLPPEADEVLLASLAPEPAERYGSVEEFAAGLLPLLGDPVAGREGLVTLVAELVAEDDPEGAGGLSRLGLWDRLSRREPLLRRIAAALVCGWLAYGGIMAIGLGWAAAAGAVAVAVVAASLAPQAGLVAGIVLLAAGGITVNPWLGATVAVAGALWWAAIGRRGGWAGFAPFFAPLFGALGLGPALPMLIGFFMPGTWIALAAGAMTGLIAVIASASAPLPYVAQFPGVEHYILQWPIRPAGAYAQIASDPLPALTMIACWTVAAGAMSLLAKRASRPAAVAGALAAALATFAVGPLATGGEHISTQAVVQTALSLILVFVVIALGPPVAAEVDD